MIHPMKRFIKDERGLETLEYAIMLGLIVVGTIVLIAALGGWIRGQFYATVEDLTPYGASPE